jgi:DNA-directed RNA polymerase subunit beta
MFLYITNRTELQKELVKVLSNLLLEEKIPFDLYHAETGELLIPAHRKISRYLVRKLARNYRYLEMESGPLNNKIREIVTSFERKFTELKTLYQSPIPTIDLSFNDWL